MAFAFYDLETTGQSTTYDQPLQFAAILTDDDLKQVERVNLRCRIAPHILPSPGAIAVTGVETAQFVDENLPSWFEFMGDIHQLIERWAPATWTGFNSIRFDEAMLRQSLYQTLQPDIFATQFNGNTRLDIMTLVFATHVQAPHILNWPENEKGKTSFKLDQLAPANGFQNHDAHDALGDVEATIHLASLIGDAEPELWEVMLQNRDKENVRDRLTSGEPLMLIERFGAGSPTAIYGCGCGFNTENNNAACYFDLMRADPADYVDADDEAILKAMSASPMKIRSVALNKTPPLFPLEAASDDLSSRARLIAGRPDFQQRVGALMSQHMREKYPAPEEGEEIRIEDRIFDGFYSNADKQRLREFQKADWPARHAMIGSFDDARLRQLGQRMVIMERPDLCTSDVRVNAAANILAKWTSNDSPKRNGWSTFASVEEELQGLEAEGVVSPEKARELRQFYDSRRAAIAAGSLDMQPLERGTL